MVLFMDALGETKASARKYAPALATKRPTNRRLDYFRVLMRDNTFS